MTLDVTREGGDTASAEEKVGPLPSARFEGDTTADISASPRPLFTGDETEDEAAGEKPTPYVFALILIGGLRLPSNLPRW